MVVAVLVVVWVVALTPYALRKLGEWQVSSELDRFRRGLRALREFSPEQDDEPAAAAAAVRQPSDSVAEPDGRRQAASRPSRAERERAAQLVMRRRRTLTWLVGSLVGSFLLGAIPLFRPLWDLSLVVLILTVAYLGALVYLQRQAALAAEREAKIVRLRALRSGEGVWSAGARPAEPERSPLVRLRPVAVAGGGGPDPASVVVALPRRPAFVLIESPS